MIKNNYGPKNDRFDDPMDGEYIGNIWGWKFSMISLGLILALVALMAYRHYSLGINPLDQGIEKVKLEKPIHTPKKAE